jgi:hypothetical protein
LKSILKSITNQIEAKDRDHNGNARISSQIGRDEKKLSAVIQHRTPRGCWRFDSQSQEAQAALGDNRCGQPKGGLDKHGRKEIGQQVSRNNASRLAAKRPRRLNELTLSERKNLASD